jgi:hypothetical protein
MQMKFITTTVTVTALLMAGMTVANAIPSVTLTDGINSVTVQDGDSNDRNPLPGVVTYLGSLGSTWWLNVTTGISKPARGSASDVAMDLNSVDASSSGSGYLRILFSDNDFTEQGSALALIGGTTTGSVEYSTWADPKNELFAEKSLLTGPSILGSGAFSGTYSGSVVPVDTYSLTMDVVITHNSAGVTSFDAALSVPEASSTVMLLGLSLTAMGCYTRSRKEV